MSVVQGADLNSILGLGYASWATVDEFTVALLPSTVSEQEDLIPSDGTWSSNEIFSSGRVAAKNRRVLNLELRTHLTPATLPLIPRLLYDGRRSTSARQAPHSLRAILANGEGYQTNRAHCERVTLTTQDNGLLDCTFSFKAHVWNELPSDGPTPVFRRLAATGHLLPSMRPLASWRTFLEQNLINGAVLSWQLQFDQNWDYQFLCEGTNSPSNPTIAHHGPLYVQLCMTVLAQRGEKPQETGTATVKLSPTFGVKLPKLLRDSKTPDNFGQRNGPIVHQVQYMLVGELPLTVS